MLPDDHLLLRRSLARRHFMGITAAGAARLSSIAIASVSPCRQDRQGNGYIAPGDPQRGRGHNCFGRVDLRDPIQVDYARIATRAMALAA